MSLHPRSSQTLIDSKIQRSLPLLYRWFQRHQRPLPWRASPTPYHIAVSEFMCQQTRIATVLPYYRRWLRRFPNWSSPASLASKLKKKGLPPTSPPLLETSPISPPPPPAPPKQKRRSRDQQDSNLRVFRQAMSRYAGCLRVCGSAPGSRDPGVRF